MNDKQKWFVVIAVGCISSVGMALSIEGSTWANVMSTIYWRSEVGMSHSWTGCVLFGMLCSSITGFFLFKDK